MCPPQVRAGLRLFPASVYIVPHLLYLLALSNLVIGTGAFVVGGIVGPMSAALQVSPAAAGQAMTVYALSTALLAPLLLVATGRWPRRRALVFAMLLFGAGNAICALAPSLPVLLAGRALMGAGAMFTPVAAGIAVAVVPPAQRGRALSLAFLGMSLSYVIGLPLGSWLGLRHGWHWPIGVVAIAALLVAGLLLALAPRQIAAPGASFAGLGRLLAQPPVRATLATTLLYFTAIFIVVSYFDPVLQALVPMSAGALSLTLMAFGCAGVAGTLLGGWANDRFGAQRSLRVQLSLLGATMLALPFTAGHHGLLLAVLVLWACAGFGMMTPQQSRLAALAPAQAPILLSINASMLYFGTALGAAVGGAAVGATGFAHLSWVGAPFAATGLAILLFGHPASRPTIQPTNP